MLGFLRHFAPFNGRPIGVDLGTSMLRLAQVDGEGADLRLVHADSIEVPQHLPAGQSTSDFFVESLRRALKPAKFAGRNIAVALPASAVTVKHVRIPRGGEAADIAAAVNEQAVALLGGEASDWFIRSAVAGEVSGESPPQQEAIAFATPRSFMEQLIDDTAAARVELAGVQVQARVIAAAFGEIHRRKADIEAVNLFVDLGSAGTRASVAAPIALKFVRDVPVRVSELHNKIARALSIDPAAATILRRAAIAKQTSRSNEINGAPAEPTGDAELLTRLKDATDLEARRLADELELCRRYYEATFPTQPITKLVFTGGGAKDRLLCAAVAEAMALPAQIGDPLVRFNRAALPSLSCIDRRDAQPDWTMAIGLSMCSQPAGVK